jgi:hypothetical protein
MKLLKNDFVRPFALGFAVASAFVFATMHHGPQVVSESMLPSAQAAVVSK